MDTESEIRFLTAQISSSESDLAIDEANIARLKELYPMFYSSDRMMQLEDAVNARRLYLDLKAAHGVFSKEEIVDMIRKVLLDETESEVESTAFIRIIKESVPNKNIYELMFYSDLTPEQIIDKAYEVDGRELAVSYTFPTSPASN